MCSVSTNGGMKMTLSLYPLWSHQDKRSSQTEYRDLNTVRYTTCVCVVYVYMYLG